MVAQPYRGTDIFSSCCFLFRLFDIKIICQEKEVKAQNKPEISDNLGVPVLNLLPKVSTLLNLVAVNLVKVGI